MGQKLEEIKREMLGRQIRRYRGGKVSSNIKSQTLMGQKKVEQRFTSPVTGIKEEKASPAPAVSGQKPASHMLLAQEMPVLCLESSSPFRLHDHSSSPSNYLEASPKTGTLSAFMSL